MFLLDHRLRVLKLESYKIWHKLHDKFLLETPTPKPAEAPVVQPLKVTPQSILLRAKCGGI